MKFYESSHSYDYAFPTVTLAYFLRYPNPYSKHVLTSDVIDRYIDPQTGRLHTTRLHLKKSKIPRTMLKLLPKGIGGPEDAGQSYILEKSVVDVRAGWMRTVSRNMEWTGILSVVESQFYLKQPRAQATATRNMVDGSDLAFQEDKHSWTDVTTTVQFESHFEGALLWKRKKIEEGEERPKKKERGFLSSWTTSGMQKSIELIGMTRTRDALAKSKEGMNVVLERLRSGGIKGVLEGMRKDREAMLGAHGQWKRVWLNGKHEHSAASEEGK
jgi:4-amino-4-deoxychorismate lyase